MTSPTIAWFERLEKRTDELFFRVVRIEKALNLPEEELIELRRRIQERKD